MLHNTIFHSTIHSTFKAMFYIYGRKIPKNNMDESVSKFKSFLLRVDYHKFFSIALENTEKLSFLILSLGSLFCKCIFMGLFIIIMISLF